MNGILVKLIKSANFMRMQLRLVTKQLQMSTKKSGMLLKKQPIRLKRICYLKLRLGLNQ
jgi:hypothetical protein